MRKNLLDPMEFRDSPQLTLDKKGIDEEVPKQKVEPSPKNSFYQKWNRSKAINSSIKSDSVISSDRHLSIFDKYADCTICLEAFVDGQKVKVMPGCSHIFHEKCCSDWLDYKFKCPNCNVPIRFAGRAGSLRDAQQESPNDSIEEQKVEGPESVQEQLRRRREEVEQDEEWMNHLDREDVDGDRHQGQRRRRSLHDEL
jgi:hypothetical protein